MSLAFFITTLVVVVTPGTGVIYTLSAGLAHGRRASVVAAAGCTLGVVPHMAATITGLAALLHTSAVAFQILKYLGAAYLLYMAWSTLRDNGEIAPAAGTAPRSASRVVASAILINLLNPKLTIFFVAFLPQFVRTGQPGAVGRMVALSVVFMAVTFVVLVAYGIFAATVRHHVLRRPAVLRWARRVFAGSFVALGARLAVTDG